MPVSLAAVASGDYHLCAGDQASDTVQQADAGSSAAAFATTASHAVRRASGECHFTRGERAAKRRKRTASVIRSSTAPATVFVDADNTLWDTDSVFADAQRNMLERVEAATNA